MAAQKTDAEASAGRGTITILLLLIVAGGAGAWYWNTRKAETAAASSPVKSTLRLETFVVNLSDSGQRAYLRAGVDLGLGRDIGRNEDAPPVAKIRDTILGILAEAKVDDLLTEKGKANLKADLLRALQERVPGQKVEEVYFTELLIQR